MAEDQQGTEVTKPRIPTRKPKPTPAGKAGRMVAAGGAVGVSLALVGAMSAAAGHAGTASDTAVDESQASVRRVVVVPNTAPQPQQIVIVLPDSMAGQAGQISTVSGQPQTVVAAPAMPVAPAPAPQPVTPVTQSSGS